jgi:DNA-binding CsgD family transcriptional regulator
MSKSIDLETVLLTIRRAALDADLWPKVQTQTADYIGAPVCQIAIADHSHDRRFASRTIGLPELDEALPAWISQAEVVNYADANRNWRHIVDYDYIDEEGMRRSPFYSFNDQFDIRYRMVLRLTDSPDKSEAMLWAWSATEGHAQAEHLRRLAHIEEALRAAAYVCATRHDSAKYNPDISNLLESFDLAAFVVEPDGRLQYANMLGERYLSGNAELFLDDGILKPRAKASRKYFKKLLADCGFQSVNGEPGTLASFVRLKEPARRFPLSVRVTPLEIPGHFLYSARALVLVLIDSVGINDVCVENIAIEHGLTEAETCVLRHFGAARSLREISQLRGVSNETVRRQIKEIMSKMGVSRQVELALRLAFCR